MDNCTCGCYSRMIMNIEMRNLSTSTCGTKTQEIRNTDDTKVSFDIFPLEIRYYLASFLSDYEQFKFRHVCSATLQIEIIPQKKIYYDSMAIIRKYMIEDARISVPIIKINTVERVSAIYSVIFDILQYRISMYCSSTDKVHRQRDRRMIIFLDNKVVCYLLISDKEMHMDKLQKTCTKYIEKNIERNLISKRPAIDYYISSGYVPENIPIISLTNLCVDLPL